MRSIATIGLLLLLGTSCSAQERLQGPDESGALLGGSKTARILDDRVEWKPKARTLKWTVEFGVEKDGKFKPSRAVTYEIDFQNATMTDGKRVYRFSQDEQVTMVRALHRYLTEYAVASSEWFVKGGPVRQRPKRNEEDEVHL